MLTCTHRNTNRTHDNYQYIFAESTLRTKNNWKRLWRRQEVKIIRNMAHGYMKEKKRFLLDGNQKQFL